MKEIKKFAQKAMRTTDVRIDVKLNKQVWSKVSSWADCCLGLQQAPVLKTMLCAGH